MRENSIEWVTGEDRITLSLTQKKYITKVKKLKVKHPEACDYIENKDGSVVAHLPLKALKLNIIDTSDRDYSNIGFAKNKKVSVDE